MNGLGGSWVAKRYRMRSQDLSRKPRQEVESNVNSFCLCMSVVQEPSIEKVAKDHGPGLLVTYEMA